MKVSSLAVLLALAPSVAMAQARPTKPSEFTAKFPDYSLSTDVFDFPTGLRIMMQPDHSHPVVGAFTVINHGTKDDPKGKEETAHFCEHLWFRSAQLEFPSIMNFVFDYGTLFNATTRNDWTDYRTVLSKEYIDILLQLESARLTGPHEGVTEEMVDTEREVIRSEWRRRNEQDVALFVDYVYESVYPEEHPYHDHSTHSSIDNIKLADLAGFMDQYYRADTTTIFIVGDFSPEEELDLILDNFDPKVLDSRLDPKEHYFEYPRPGIKDPDQNNPDHWFTGAWDPSSPKEARTPYKFPSPEERKPRITQDRTPVPELASKEVATRQGPFTSKMVALAWSLPGGFRQDEWNITQVANTASGYIAGGLADLRGTRAEIMREDNRIGDVGCFPMGEVVNTTVICYAELLDDKLDPLMVRDRMVDQLAEIWNPENFTGVGGQVYNFYFTRGKLEILTDTMLNLDLFATPFGGRYETLVPHAHLVNSVTPFTDGMNSAMQMDPQTISKLAYEYLKRDRAATVILEPLPEDEIDVGSEKSSYSGSNVMDNALKFSDDLTQFDAATIAELYVEPDLSQLTDYTLPNGLRVVVLPHGEAPIVEARLILGRNSDTEPKNALTWVTAFTESAGNDPLPIAAQVSWMVDPGIPGLSPAYGNVLSTVTGSRHVTLDVRAPSGNLDGALWLLRDEVESAKPYMDGAGLYVKRRREKLERQWLGRQHHIDTAINTYLYPGTPSRTPTTWEDLDTMATWTSSTVDGYLAQTFQPKNATLVVVGNLDVAEAQKHVQTYFGGWQARPNAPAPPEEVKAPALPSEPAKILIFDDAKRTQTDVTMYCRLDLKGTPGEDIAVDVVSSLMGDRIFNEIRVNRGLAYSPNAYAAIDDSGAGRAVFLSDGVVNSGVGQILSYYKQVVHEVTTGTIDPNELLASQVRHSRGDGLTWQSNQQVADNLQSLIGDNKPWSTVGSRGEDLAAITIEQAAALMANCEEHSITTIEGPKEIVIPQLDELGYTYEVVEWRALGDELMWKYDPKAAKKNEKDRLKQEKKDAKKKPEDDASADGN